MTKWYADHSNIYELAEWMVENDHMSDEYEVLLRLIEKPWKWNAEWELFQDATSALRSNANGVAKQDMDSSACAIVGSYRDNRLSKVDTRRLEPL